MAPLWSGIGLWPAENPAKPQGKLRQPPSPVGCRHSGARGAFLQEESLGSGSSWSRLLTLRCGHCYLKMATSQALYAAGAVMAPLWRGLWPAGKPAKPQGKRGASAPYPKVNLCAPH